MTRLLLDAKRNQTTVFMEQHNRKICSSRFHMNLRLPSCKHTVDGHYNQICQCGSIKTELHTFFEYPFPYTSRQMLISNVCKILVNENMFSHSEFTSLNHIELTKILLFGHPDLSKTPSLCLLKQTCLFLSNHPPF